MVYLKYVIARVSHQNGISEACYSEGFPPEWFIYLKHVIVRVSHQNGISEACYSEGFPPEWYI